MTTLTINNADGSHYWTCHFNSLAEAQAWYEIEKKRSYWDPQRTFTMENVTNVVVDDGSSAAYKLLASTDWYVVREMDNGTKCPPDIKQARADARTKLQSLGKSL